MFRATTSPLPVQWDKQLFTKDGRPRARRPISAFHRVKWSKRLPMTISASLCAGSAMILYRFYSQSVSLTPQQRFLNKISVVPHGVLGSHMHDSASLVFVADSPDYNTVITDPAGLHHIHGVADGAGGAAAAIYKWLGIKGEFPQDVRLSISGIGDAKLHRYPLPESLRKQEQEKLDKKAAEALAAAAKANNNNNAYSSTTAASSSSSSSSTAAAGHQQSDLLMKPLPAPGSSAEYTAAHQEQLIKARKEAGIANSEQDLINEKLFSRAVIHAIGPDFRVGKWTDREASLALSRGYRNILHEFVKSDCDTLRIAPLSGGIFSGPLYNQMPVLTQEGLAQGFDQLHEYDKEVLLQPKKKIELCIFLLREWDTYCNAFDYVAPPSSYSK